MRARTSSMPSLPPTQRLQWEAQRPPRLLASREARGGRPRERLSWGVRSKGENRETKYATCVGYGVQKGTLS